MHWVCPYCHHAQAVTNPKFATGNSHLDITGNVHDEVGIRWQGIGCANDDCREVQLTIELVHYLKNPNGTFRILSNSPAIRKWRVMPDGVAKPQPSYIPQQIRDDYREACQIKDISPKAAATLARRCLQGMIRDFAKVKPGRLFDEIERLSKGVEDGTAPRDVSIDSIAALNSVRKIGNIGAHMENDVDLIVPVEPSEAGALIELVELLLDEWYVERHKRTQRFARVAQIEEAKAEIVSQGKKAAKEAANPVRRAEEE